MSQDIFIDNPFDIKASPKHFNFYNYIEKELGFNIISIRSKVIFDKTILNTYNPKKFYIGDLMVSAANRGADWNIFLYDHTGVIGHLVKPNIAFDGAAITYEAMKILQDIYFCYFTDGNVTWVNFRGYEITVA